MWTRSPADMTSLATTWAEGELMNATAEMIEKSRPSENMENVSIYIAFYALIFLIVLGLICNALSIGVFVTSPTLRRTTTGQYLVALAVADSLYLIGALIRWLAKTTWNYEHIIPAPFMHRYNVVCKGVYVLRYTFKFLSAWITVVITAERFLTVAFPLRVSSISTLTTARMTIAITTVVSIALNLFPIWLIGLKPFSDGRIFCRFLYRDRYDLWSMVVQRMGQLVIPSVLIFVFTGLIIFFVRRASRQRRLHLSGSRRSGGRVGRSVEKQLTIMLISVAVASLVFRLPYMLAYYMNLKKDEIWPGGDRWISYRTRFATSITHIIQVLNYVLNFFLYCLCGSAFRSQLIHWLPIFRYVMPGGEPRRSSNANTSTRKPPPTAMTNANSFVSSVSTKM